MIVFCKMDPEAKGARGLGAVYVKKDAPGVSFGPAETLMGFRGVPSADIYFEDVKIAPDDVLLPAVSVGVHLDMFWDPPLCSCMHARTLL
jgi:alkylation response protein AidB-like acyl-CoA dehydrogenase|eukprot:COSAG02_NODE_35324_length_470_cov_0.800539_1_plen_90_part_00